MVEAAPHLDGSYAAFGAVIEGMEEAGRIARVKRNFTDKSLEDQIIKNVTVENYGVEYGQPEKM